MKGDTKIHVRFTAEGWHRWPEASGDRSYLSDRHRHLFYVQVNMTVEHDDRDVEFHDLMELCRSWWPGPELGRSSCEAIARGYCGWLQDRYPGRGVSVSVWEDNETGATVTAAPGDDEES